MAAFLGGSDYDSFDAIAATPDGGCIIGGYTHSADGDIQGFLGGSTDALVIKLDAAGEVQWQRLYGGIGDESALAITTTSDGGYIFAGGSTNVDGDVSNNNGGVDYWVVKLDPSGDIQWERSFGGSLNEIALSVIQTSDGGYMAAGRSNSLNGDITASNGGLDFWVIKLTPDGALDWEKSLGGTDIDIAHSVRQTADGGYVVAGQTSSSDGMVTGSQGGNDYWIVKLDATGGLEWQRTYGGSLQDEAYSIEQTSDMGYIVAGSSSSSDGDVAGNLGSNDYWVVKLDASGDLQWERSLGGSFNDACWSIKQLNDGGYICAGQSSSFDGQVTDPNGFLDFWIARIDADGELLWERSYGGTTDEMAHAIALSADGGAVIAGVSDSNDGDLTSNQGDYDGWVVKISADVVSIEVIHATVPVIHVFPNPVLDRVTMTLTLEREAQMEIQLYNAAGQMIEHISEARLPKGDHQFTYSTRDLPSGTYHLRVLVDGVEVSRRVVKM